MSYASAMGLDDLPTIDEVYPDRARFAFSTALGSELKFSLGADYLAAFYARVEAEMIKACDAGLDLAVSDWDWDPALLTSTAHIAAVGVGVTPDFNGRRYTRFATGTAEAREKLAAARAAGRVKA